MKQTYYEITIQTNNFAFISDFVFAFDVDAVEEDKDSLIVRTEDYPELLIFALDELIKRLADCENKLKITYSISEKENKDWIAEYQKNVQPIRIDDIYIHTSWQDPLPDCLNLKIDPALAFGSGHHESTKMCIQALNQLLADENSSLRSALDVGCGSGILSLLLSARGLQTDACDTDELAIISTKSNFAINNLSLNHIWHGSASLSTKKYDLVVANIIADVILIIKNDLLNALSNNGFLVLSGILKIYENKILDQFSHLNLHNRYELGDWITLVYKAK